MNNVNPDVCSCCGEIYNRVNLNMVNLGGRRKLMLCPECYEAYESLIKKVFTDGYNTHKTNEKLDIKCDPEVAFHDWNTGGSVGR